MKGRLILAALAALVVNSSAQADVAASSAQAETTWRFQITPYIWATGISGNVRPLASGPTFTADKSFGDLLKDLDAAFFLHGTARRDRFLLFADFTWASVSEGRDATVLGFPVSASARVSQTSLTLAAGYSVVQQPAMTVDLLGGLRAWRVKASASATLPIIGTISRSETESWADPILGARMRVGLAPKWSLILYADVGGFGAGSQSTWQALGTVNYQVTDHLFLSAGYRHMAFDYRKDGKILDIDITGPLVGATWRF